MMWRQFNAYFSYAALPLQKIIQHLVVWWQKYRQFKRRLCWLIYKVMTHTH